MPHVDVFRLADSMSMKNVGDADFVCPPLRRDSRRVFVPGRAEVGQVSEGEDGRKTGDVGERSCRGALWQVRQHVRHDAGMTNYFLTHNAQFLSHAC